MFKSYRGLAIEGGGMAGLAYMGAISKFIDAGHSMNQFTTFAGSSAGSMPAGLLAVRADIEYISKNLKETNFSKFLDGSWTYIGDMWRVYKSYGWYEGQTLENWYSKLMEEITGNANITFLDIYNRYNTHLIITKVDVLYPKSKLVIMDYKSHPNFPVCKAVHESCTIPYFFKAVKGTGAELGHLYVDGGILLNYPITTLYDILRPEEVMGLCLTHEKSTNDKSESRPIKTHLEFVESIANAWKDMALNRHVSSAEWKRTCNIEVTTKSTDFKIDDVEKEDLYERGRKAMTKFLHRH